MSFYFLNFFLFFLKKKPIISTPQHPQPTMWGLILFWLLGLAGGLAVEEIHRSPDCVLMESISTLSFQSGSLTVGRRSAPISQLNCSNCSTPLRQVQCMQHASKKKWTCSSSSVDSLTEILSATISCEGCSTPSDPFVLKGSCSLMYHVSSDKEWNAWTIAVEVGMWLGFLATVVCYERLQRRWMTPEEREREAQDGKGSILASCFAESVKTFVAQSVRSL